MTHPLHGDARWAREKQVEAQAQVAHWRDPEWVERKARVVRRNMKRLRTQFEAEIGTLHWELRDCADPERGAARAEADARRWDGLATAYEARIVAAADTDALEGL